MERQFGELDLEPVENLRGNLAVFGKKTDLFGALIGFIDHLQALAPSRLLRVIDLAQVKDGALRGVSGTQTAVLDHAPVAMLFAIFLAGVIAQKHVVGRAVYHRGANGVEGGRSPLGALENHAPCGSTTYASRKAKKEQSRAPTVKFRVSGHSNMGKYAAVLKRRKLTEKGLR